MSSVNDDQIRDAVRNQYNAIAIKDDSCGCGATCCEPAGESRTSVSSQLGYSEDDLASLPQGVDMGLGCGNPQALAALREGEVVLDLGSGGGLDCFLAAQQVGSEGRAIGVDMTPAMVSKARLNTERGGFQNVEFRLGEIENLPVPDGSIDVVISNCVINLSPDKPRVFREAFRALRPGGRMAISDVVAFAEIPESTRQDTEMYSACIAGASTVIEVDTMLRDAGFTEIRIEPKFESSSFMNDWAPGADITDYVVSATIEATKPA